MRERRSKLEIFWQILEATSGEGRSKTRIMYRAGVSYYQLKRYLNLLIERGLIAEFESNGLTIYKLTEKGRRVLESFRVIGKELLEIPHPPTV